MRTSMFTFWRLEEQRDDDDEDDADGELKERSAVEDGRRHRVGHAGHAARAAVGAGRRRRGTRLEDSAGRARGLRLGLVRAPDALARAHARRAAVARTTRALDLRTADIVSENAASSLIAPRTWPGMQTSGVAGQRSPLPSALLLAFCTLNAPHLKTKMLREFFDEQNQANRQTYGSRHCGQQS